MCSNPQIVTELGFSPAVRGLELHCRKGWSNDFWQASTDDVVLEIRTKNPDAEQDSGKAPVAAAGSLRVLDESEPLTYNGNDRVVSLSVAAERRDA